MNPIFLAGLNIGLLTLKNLVALLSTYTTKYDTVSTDSLRGLSILHWALNYTALGVMSFVYIFLKSNSEEPEDSVS